MAIKVSLIFIFIMLVSKVNAYDEYNNPVDGKIYITDKWNTYYPDNYQIKSINRVNSTEIRLLNTDKQINVNLTVDELSAYIINIEKQANTSINEYKSDGVILLQVSLNPNLKADYKISYKGNIDQKFLSAFYSDLQNINFPKVNISTVKFLIELNVK